MTEPVQPTLTELMNFFLKNGGIATVRPIYFSGVGVTLSQCCATIFTEYVKAHPQSPGDYYNANFHKFLRFGPSDNNESHYKDTHPHRVTLTIKDPTMNLKLDWPIL